MALFVVLAEGENKVISEAPDDVCQRNSHQEAMR